MLSRRAKTLNERISRTRRDSSQPGRNRTRGCRTYVIARAAANSIIASRSWTHASVVRVAEIDSSSTVRPSRITSPPAMIRLRRTKSWCASNTAYGNRRLKPTARLATEIQ